MWGSPSKCFFVFLLVGFLSLSLIFGLNVLTMANHQELSNLIWTTCDDILRGLFKPHEYGDVILPFVVLRRLDCVLEPQKDKVIELYAQFKDKVSDPAPIILNQIGTSFYNTSRFDLRRLKQDPQNIFLNFGNYLNGYDEGVREIIDNFQLEKPIEFNNELH